MAEGKNVIDAIQILFPFTTHLPSGIFGNLLDITLQKHILIKNALHSQCVTNIEVGQAFSSWSNVGRLRFDQHLVK